jgi:DNA-binding Xre family transcriptional regulator
MIKVNIKEIAEKNGITTAYQLQKKLGIQPSLAAKWYKNDLKMIGFDSLNTLCKAFKCLPSDILIYVADAESAQISNGEPQDADKPKYYTKNGLKSRGWTTGMIKDLYGKPDFFKPIRCGNMRPRYYYDETKVKAIESTNAFKERARPR